jgi:phosphopantothenoylcysteine decarboxylase / phosphopantothenate---cysteine ligase
VRVLVTAGPTREPIDPVRYLSNRSSGKMGYAVARAAAARGHQVVLVSGPVALRAPRAVRVVRVGTAADMLAAVRRHLAACDALVMAAAVADWTPAVYSPSKLKKGQGGARSLRLVPTADILSTLRPRKGRRIYVGFAAETDRLEEESRRKLAAKGLDLIVGNDVTQPGAGFEVDTNRVTLVYADGRVERWPQMLKTAVARRLVRCVERLRADA